MDTPADVSAKNIAKCEEPGLTYQTVAEDINKYLGTAHMLLYILFTHSVPTSTMYIHFT